MVILSGGESSRFGSPKALVDWNGRPLIADILQRLLASKLDEIIVVLGAGAKLIEPFLLKHKKIKVVYNKDYKLGQTSSFKTGWRALSPGTRAAGLLPVDYPLLKTETVDQLINEFTIRKPLFLVPAYQNRKGHPPFFHFRLGPEILGLSVETGLNSLMKNHSSDVAVYEVDDPGVGLSFNTPEELRIISEK